MAGGKLSAVYTLGKLRAWFIAYADFLVSWKPFAYQARIGVSLGASYRVDCWFVHKTFSVELAAALDLWGPEVHGAASRFLVYHFFHDLFLKRGGSFERDAGLGGIQGIVPVG